MDNNLQQRLIVSFFGIVILLIVIFLSDQHIFKLLFAALTAGVISLALWEYYTIARNKGFQPLIKIGIIGSLFFIAATFLKTQFSAKMLPEIVLGFTLVASFAYYFIKGSDPFVNLAITGFGILYLVLPLSYIIDINYFVSEPIVRDGRWCLIYLLCVTKVTDAAAFFVGKKIGTTQLSPYISPKKTWEGALGGLLGALIISILYYAFLRHFFELPPFNITFFQSVWLALLISIAAQFGDLSESLLKRDVGVKDSSRLPGLGGMLDVVDSLVFTAPLMYIFLKLNSEY